jgi:YVTN family beta-propeller protein
MPSFRFVMSLLVLGFSLTLSAQQQYQVVNRIPFSGQGGWDYLFADSVNRQLYISHSSQVEVVDLDSQKPVAQITGLNRIHGIAVADDLNRGFISDGGDNVVAVFDLKSHSISQKVKAGTNPDGIIYEPGSKRVFAFNGRSNDVTVLDAASSKVVGTVALGGKPEFPVIDGKGNVYVNIEDKSEIVQLNSSSLQVEKRWPLAPCKEPSGLAMDISTRRLFSVCDNQKMAVVDADSGKMIATVAIGNGPDATAYDADKKLVFSSNGQDGTLTVIKQDSADKYSVVETVPTEKSARTMALDRKTHYIYLSAAQFGPPPAPTTDNPHPRPTIVPDSFHVLVVSGR